MRAAHCIYGIKLDVSRSFENGLRIANFHTHEVTISSLTVTNSRRRTVLNVVPNAFPATRVSATRDLGDNSIVEYVQVRSKLLLLSGIFE
jgi:Arf-GAP/SH3 domain/ANK repeat/PH domain-containing protein